MKGLSVNSGELSSSSPKIMSAPQGNRAVLKKNKADLLRTVSYVDVAAHLLSRGVISMPEHRQVVQNMDEVSRVNKMIEIIGDRQDSARHLVEAMRDPILKGKYNPLVRTMSEGGV